VRNLTADAAPIPLLRTIAETPGLAAIGRDLDGVQSTRRACVDALALGRRVSCETARDSRDEVCVARLLRDSYVNLTNHRENNN
jgi:hypothetical protein